MKKNVFTKAILAATAAVAIACTSPAYAAPDAAPKIGVVSLERVAADFKARADAFQKNAPAMSQNQRLNEQRELTEAERALNREQRAFREELGQRQNEEIQIVIARANQVIQDLARRENYDLIVQDAVYVSPRVDITASPGFLEAWSGSTGTGFSVDSLVRH